MYQEIRPAFSGDFLLIPLQALISLAFAKKSPQSSREPSIFSDGSLVCRNHASVGLLISSRRRAYTSSKLILRILRPFPPGICLSSMHAPL